MVPTDVPKTYTEAIDSGEGCKQEINEEVKSLEENQLVEPEH